MFGNCHKTWKEYFFMSKFEGLFLRLGMHAVCVRSLVARSAVVIYQNIIQCKIVV